MYLPYIQIPQISDPSQIKLKVEWQTVAVIVAIYSCWLGLTYFHASIPGALLFTMGGALVAWHSSLQHEIIHGHPTSNKKLNWLFALPPLALWLPFEIYRRSHLEHHRDEVLTDPSKDPESKYWDPLDWDDLTAVGQFVALVQAPLLGRLLIGPFWSIGLFLTQETNLFINGDKTRRKIWLNHALLVVPVILWLTLVCKMNLLEYLYSFVYPGTAILLLRSFAEHRAVKEVKHRTAIVERAHVFGLLFLNNNLHAVHHRHPTLPWYDLPAKYEENREEILNENGGLVYDGYGDVLKRFLFTPHDVLLHPSLRPVDKRVTQ